MAFDRLAPGRKDPAFRGRRLSEGRFYTAGPDPDLVAHSITRSARAVTDAGTVMLSNRAVRELSHTS